MKLRLFAEHQDDAYPEIGEISSLYWNRDRTLFAVVSVRATAHTWVRPRLFSPHCQRLSLYEAATKRLIGAVSGIHHKILEVCFHPSDSVMLIGTGEYDGGFYLEGELVSWNWRSNEKRFLAVTPSVYRARFVSATDVELLISPIDNEDVDQGQEPHKTFRLTSFALPLRAEERIPSEKFCRPLAVDVTVFKPGFEPLGMYTEQRKAFEASSRSEVLELLGIGGNRGVVTDIIATGSQLLTTKDRPTLERRSPTGDIVEIVESSFTGSQIFPLPDGRFLLNTDKYALLGNRPEKVYGRLLVWESISGQVSTLLEGANPFLLSQRADGLVLARTCSHYSDEISTSFRQPIGVDFLIDRSLTKRPIAPLGSANHNIYITTKGSRHLYHYALEFPWPGWGKKPQPRNMLFIIDEDAVSRPADYDDKRPSAETLHATGRFLATQLFCAFPTLSGEALIGAGYLANHPIKWLVWRHDVSGKAWLWVKDFGESIQMLLGIPEKNAVLVGFEGCLRLLNADSGETLDEMPLTFAGIPSIARTGCLNGSEIILATLESRILRLEID